MSSEVPLELDLVRRFSARVRQDRLAASYVAYGLALALIALIRVDEIPFRHALSVLCDSIPLFRGLANASSDPDAYRVYFGICIALAGLQIPFAILETARQQRLSGRSGMLPSLMVSSIALPFVALVLLADVPTDFATVADATQKHRAMARIVLTNSTGLAIAGSFLVTALLIFTNWALTPVSYLVSKLPIQDKDTNHANQ